MPEMTSSLDEFSVQPAAQALLARALASVANAIFITDREGKIMWANAAFVRLSGFSLDELLRRSPAILKSGNHGADFYAQLWQTIQAGKVWQGEMVDRHKDGSFYTVDEIITPLCDDAGNITHFIALQHDITGRQQEIARAHYLAFHDTLTQLPNRASFVELQAQAIAYARRNGRMLATLFLDLDKFKPVNDTMGHHIGDMLLMAAAERMRAAVRQADTVARIGGDEFAILIGDLDDAEVAARLTQKLLDTLARPFVVLGQEILISASIGISIYPADGEDPESLLIHADQAMYAAKCHGGNSYRLYDASLSIQA
jgi:diguanylate cyclase (GGDEF)-like protein/PAS domain S-box-containing protein